MEDNGYFWGEEQNSCPFPMTMFDSDFVWEDMVWTEVLL